MENISRYLVIAGLVLIVLGGLFWLGGRIGLPLGRLPGDIRIDGGSGTFYFPIVTSILLSVVLTVILNLIARFWNK
ncbi:MAG TPA: DUF2905 domain-containing protein [Anaerolineales bacterium]|jgi:hypothetical protein